jgi:hypothetical protein
MSKLKGMLGAMMMMSAMSQGGHFHREELTIEDKKRLREKFEKERIERLKKNDVNEYFYGLNVVYARNQKNADRKARNKGFL